VITHFKGNRSPSITDTIRVDGAVFDLTGSTVKFKMRLQPSGTLKVNAAATVVTAAAGTVRYDWQATDVDTVGLYLFWWEVTLASGKIQETPAAPLVLLDHAPAQVTEYLDREELKATLTLSGETFADADIDAAISGASRAIDNYCDRRFYPDADAAQVRYYSPPGRLGYISWSQSAQVIDIDDLITLTSLKTDSTGAGTFPETWTLNSDFMLEPLNAAADGNPYTMIRNAPTSARYFPPLPRSIQVTGKFGWAVAPPEVIEATTLWANRLLRRAREAPFGAVVAGLDVGAISRITPIDPDVTSLLSQYVRRPFVA